jgi:hypothetical protein
MITLVSCNNTDIKQEPVAKLSGNIEDIGNAKLFLVNGENVDTLSVDSIGNFSYEKNISTATFPRLILGRKAISLYINKDTDLKLTTTAKNFSSDVKFEGVGASENKLMVDNANLKKNLAYFPAIFKLSPSDFMAKSDSINELFINQVDSYSKGKDIDPLFLKITKANIKYEKLLNYSNYLPYHKYYSLVFCSYKNGKQGFQGQY